nr:MAG: ORF1 [TTV-like mini virus]
MPRFWRYPYYRRRRRLWRRRPRKIIRRRYRRYRLRKHYRVRNKKLKFLRLKEWQPRRIVKMKCTGIIPLYITTNDRVSFNLRLYEDEIAPHYVPGGGGYSITNFSLSALYQLHEKGRCYWTHSNNQLPYIRYTGCTLWIYRPESSDIILNYHNCGPLEPNLLTYNSTQPTIMQLSKHHKIIRCKSKNYSKKPYTKLKIKPPSHMQNRWYFQKDFADYQLLLIQASALSLDRFYIHSSSISTTIGFLSLNTNFFQMHDYYETTTYGYYPKPQTFLWSYQQSTPKVTKISDICVKNLIYLGSTSNASAGTTINDDPSENWEQKMTHYQNTHGIWGNIFTSFYLKGPQPILTTTQHIRTVLTKTNYPTGNELLNSLNTPTFTQLTQPLLIPCRYNPFPDTGQNNKIYFTDITSTQHNWEPPTDTSYQNNNYPLWIGLFGLIDYMKLTKTATKIDTQRVLTLQSKFISCNLTYIVPIDDDVTNGVSPFRKDISASDLTHWHPKTSFQYKSVNNICLTGPGTIKLPPNVSAESHIRFMFHFKLGGCAQDVKIIEDPEKQPVFPPTNNILQSNSLQNPQQALESYLYGFDWRRDFLTPTAAERISKYKEPEKSIFQPTGINLFNPPITSESPSEGESTDEEKEKETLHLLLRHLRKQQRVYKRRILHLTNLE